jgi:hypothetical protein
VTRLAKVTLVAALAGLTAGCSRGGLVCAWFGWNCPPPSAGQGVGPNVTAPPPLPPPPPAVMDDAHKKLPPNIVQFHPGHLPLLQGQHGKPPPVAELHPGRPDARQP